MEQGRLSCTFIQGCRMDSVNGHHTLLLRNSGGTILWMDYDGFSPKMSSHVKVVEDSFELWIS